MAVANERLTNLTQQDIYSRLAIMPLHPMMNNDLFVVDLTEFKQGDTIKVPIIGESVVYDRAPGEDPKFSVPSTSRFTMTITEQKQAADAILWEDLEDAYMADFYRGQLFESHSRALMDAYFSSLFTTQSEQTAASPNLINGVPTRFIAQDTDRVIGINDFKAADYIADELKWPKRNRIAIVDYRVSEKLNSTPNIINLSNNPDVRGFIETGFRQENNQGIPALYNWHVIFTDLLDDIATETILGATATNAKACLFMCVDSTNTKGIARAWRRNLTPTFFNNIHQKQEEYWTDYRFGFARWREDGLIVGLSNKGNYVIN